MSHKPPIKPGESIDRYLARVKAEHETGGGDGGDGDVKLPLSIQPIGGGIGMLVDADGVPVVGDDGMPILRNVDTPGGTGTTGRTQFQSERALDEAQTRLSNANAALAELEAAGTQPISPFQKQKLELDKIRAENDIKAMLMGEIGAERRTLIQEQGATKRQLLTLGPDPFRQAANLSGQVVRGFTPQQGAVGQAQQFINQDLPVLDFNATLPQLQAQLGNIQGMQAPQLAGGFGLPSLAHGGVVTDRGIAPLEMQRGSDGAFSRTPAIVGDEGPELALLPPGAEIIPLSKLRGMDLTGIPRAAHGATFGGGVMTPEQTSLFQGLQPLFQGLGLNTIPTRTMFNPVGESVTGNFGALSTLGIQPQFVREIETGFIWKITGNTRQYVGNPAAMAGINPADIVVASASEIARIAPDVGSVITTLESTQQIPQGGTPAFQALGTPLIEHATGALLPAPFKIARQLGQFQRERPDLFSNALSAFRSAGLDPSSVLAQVQAATPTGRFERPQRLGFTGARL